MLRIIFAIVCPIALSLLLSAKATAQPTVLMEIAQLPSWQPAESDMYIAGSFNGWNPHDNNFKFSRNEKGVYYVNVSLLAGNYEYKITRGSWDNAECQPGGAPSRNRVLKIPGEVTYSLIIEDWTDRYPAKPKVSTASRNVQIYDPSLLIPQLNRTRRIWVYLPPDYNSNTSKKYPVLYMQDGQNLFDEATSYAGEWGVDEYMDSLKGGQCIVVAVDHGGNKRMTEYNPYDNLKFGKGEGKQYIDFLVHTLKPQIDQKYRTLPDKAHTAIAGSSMGGLISMYAILQYPNVFGNAGVFSPSFWITSKKIMQDIKKKGKSFSGFIYMYGGKQEGEEMVTDMQKAIQSFPRSSDGKIVSIVREEGLHNEARWKVEFPLFYRALPGFGQPSQ